MHPRPRARVMLAALLPLLTTATTGCAAHEPEVVDPAEVLRALEAVRIDRLALPRPVAVVDGLSVDEAVALAARHNPGLHARRAWLPVARVGRTIAGLWPDPELEWIANNVIADLATHRRSSTNSYLAGFQLMFPLPRPGELDARVAVATARLAREAAQARAAEADLARDVRLAYTALLQAEAELELALAQVALSERVRAQTAERRALGQATDLEVGLAELPLRLARADVPRLEGEAEAARLALNALLGLPPRERWRATTTLAALASATPPPLPGPLVEAALARRPDLEAARWAHREADAEVALELALRWPRVGVGTGITIELPVFSRFNRWGVERARLARAAAREGLVEAVHALRADVHEALALAHAAHRTAEVHARALEEGADEVLRAAEAAQAAGQVPVIEVLAARAEALSARRRALAARADWAAAAVRLDAATGALAPPALPVE
ncbi:MAG: TolC family protein [Planctomycetes bacterium]|nr:TolC family protein [Planctomycetota bacterium]